MPGTYTTVILGEDETVAHRALASQEPTTFLHRCLLKEQCAVSVLRYRGIADVQMALSESRELYPAPLGQLIVTSLTRAKATSSLPRNRPPAALAIRVARASPA